ncbi:MAG TPA: anthranilate phosphoribosyltransferase, partial [Stellaceae bacterium]|nr:anthranilate phosphoribosyltransferase [Stellaceae bacterium]
MFEVTPEMAGLKQATLDDLRGGDPAANAAMLHKLLDGTEGPIRDIVLLNAAAALIVAGTAKDLKEGVAIGVKSIASGAAKQSLAKLVAITNAPDANDE